MKFRKKEKNPMAAYFVVILVLMTLSTIISIAPAMAQSPPIGLFGNPHDFRPGPPIPSCRADFNQGPPEDTIKGCRETP
jgi:hypothetical protein